MSTAQRPNGSLCHLSRPVAPAPGLLSLGSLRVARPGIVALLLLALGASGCPPVRDDDDDSAVADDDDSTGDDDDSVAGDDDDTAGDDDDTAGDDDDTAGDDDDTSSGTSCADIGGIVLDFVSTASGCDTQWSEAGVSMVYQAQSADGASCPGGCYGEGDGASALIAPAELRGAVDSLDCDVTEVRVTMRDYTGVGAARVLLFDAGGEVVASATNTMVSAGEVVTATNTRPVAAFGVEGCETFVERIELL